ncbi:3'(2'),5'-bisphosphate nucleotidase CysQ [Roseovarius sp. HI0049]|nr:3'(2'),5'-bisphosphate nucleotidase CysQ [Roseovarius sp. HI0049]
MPGNDLALLIEAARQAGEVAAGFAAETAKRWDKPGGLGPVTEADLAVNDVLERVLRAARPDYGWLSEESEDGAARLGCRRVFIVDPIDGTRSFIEGSGTWAHSLAVVEGGAVTAGVVFLPMRDRLYAAATGQGATLNGEALRVSDRTELTGASVLAAKPGYAPQHWRGAVPEVKRIYRPSLAYRLSVVAEGRADAMFTLRPTWEWDVAAGDVILREAGAATSDRAGRPLVFNNPHPQVNGIVAANPALHGAITGALVI